MFSQASSLILLLVGCSQAFSRQPIDRRNSLVVAWDRIEENGKDATADRPNPNELELEVLEQLLAADVHPLTAPDHQARPNLIQLADRLNLTTFVDLIKKSGIDKTIDHEGPYTLFAASNKAFTRMPAWSARFPLKDILKLHVAHGAYKQSELKNDQLIRSLLSKRDVRVNVYKKRDGSTIYTANGKQLNQTDFEAHNGVLHVVEGVMSAVYERDGTVFGELDSGNVPLDTFYALTRSLQGTGLSSVLSSVGPFTLLAPTDKAFAALPASLVDRLLANKTAMTRVLKHHVLEGTVYSLGLEDGGTLTTLKGDKLDVQFTSSSVKVGGANVVLPDFSVSNGVIHTIDRVLIPQDMDGEMLAWLMEDVEEGKEEW